MCDTKRSIGRKCDSGLAANVPIAGGFRSGLQLPHTTKAN
ncbi:hypothetical protein JMUB7538_26550 [Staphylococcus aureus]|uniref:Uncharacterized protein n=1 Tax=Brucella pinnipedialis (strain NCTC 12890 / B2/94 / BCCN 94-73) TaxID=520461 RepID=A0ABM9ZR80_BRUPB|nr:predicted protein [Enterococcus faecalis T8]EEY02145.1 conserved hypothetical protein [Brucella pinnipedialis B2/94]DAM69279.1 MAG TPA: hypothetical protein [Caudoviricetes sp.]